MYSFRESEAFCPNPQQRRVLSKFKGTPPSPVKNSRDVSLAEEKLACLGELMSLSKPQLATLS